MVTSSPKPPPPPLVGGPVGSDYRWSQGPADLLIEPISDSHALVTVRWLEGPIGPPKVFSAYPILGSTTVRSLTKECETQVKGFDWLGFFQSAFYQTIRHLRDGDEPVNPALTTVAPPGFIINPLILDAGATSIIAPGGNAKSFLAVCATLATVTGSSALFAGYAPQQTGPVLYLDWESTEDIFAYRLDRVARGAGIQVPREGIHYHHPKGPLADSARAWERRCAVLGIRLVVIDSVIPARGFRNTALGGGADTGVFYEALNRIGVPALLIDHTAGDDSKGDRGAWGSVLNEHKARLQWVMPNPWWKDGTLYTALHLHKTNNTSRDLPDIKLKVVFDDATETTRVLRDTSGVPRLEPARDRVKEWLEGGGQGSPKAIAEATGMDPKQVSARLTELKKQGVAGVYSGQWYALAQGTEGLI